MMGGLMVALLCWMLVCIWCGYRAHFRWFAVALILGLTLAVVWVVTVLQADPLSPNALMSFFSAVLFASASFGVGWLIGRFVQGWQGSKVRD